MKKIIIAILAFGLIISCEKQEDEIRLDDFSIQKSNLKANSSVDPKTDGVTVPFKSNFYTEQEGKIDMDACVGGFLGLNTQVGSGEATHLGRFTTKMEFCMNFTVVLDADGNPITDGNGNTIPDPDNGFGEYSVDEGKGKFFAANGDELWFTVSGKVILYAPGTHPFYIANFDDPFTFTGGTGRFEGATGGGHTNSFTNFAHTDHNWTGTITLLKSD